MQLLPLLLVSIFCLLVVEAHRDGWRDRPVSPGGKERHRNRFGRLSPEAKKRLAEKIGSLDARKARLARLERPHKGLTAEEKERLKERLAKLPKIKESDGPKDTRTDLFEVNTEEGVAEYMYQGDIDLTEEQAAEMRSSSDPARKKRQASISNPRWANNTVYYYFDSSINDVKKSVVAQALEFLQSRTCINFVQSSIAAPRIRVFSDSGCYSYIGMIGNPEQTLSMGDGCESMGTAAHEFMHALGIWHTQMRSDRDEYVTVDLTYVSTGLQSNFDKMSTDKTQNYVPYEYGSVMHYGTTAFVNTSGKFSIIPKDINYTYYLGNSEPSFLDILTINKHYGCDAACPAATSAQCKNGGVPHPRNCAKCLCPLGYDGALCDQRPSGCGETLTATASWQSKSFTFGENSFDIRKEKTYCYYMINAPSGQMIEIQLVSLYNSQCQNGCRVNGIEIKSGTDTRIQTPTYCCDEFANKTILSYNNPTPLIAYNRFHSNDFTFKYRAVSATPVPTTTSSSTARPSTTQPSTSRTTTTPPTTTLLTTKPYTAPPTDNCKSNLTEAQCVVNRDYFNFCSDPDFQRVKFNCAVECGFCGKAADPCIDISTSCPILALARMCTSWDPMFMEYQCAKTCGFCEHPN